VNALEVGFVGKNWFDLVAEVAWIKPAMHDIHERSQGSIMRYKISVVYFCIIL